MSVKAVILGILKRGPLHGYDIKRIIGQEMGDWTDIAFGSIYFALDALAKDGFVTGETLESSGRRPSRIVYTISEEGKLEYLRLLRELWQDSSRQTSPLDIGIAFLQDLPRNEVKRYLSGRVEALEHTLRYPCEHEKHSLSPKYRQKVGLFFLIPGTASKPNSSGFAKSLMACNFLSKYTRWNITILYNIFSHGGCNDKDKKNDAVFMESAAAYREGGDKRKYNHRAFLHDDAFQG
jgi:DNA-binding PadR family transcriptional regulator